MRILVVVKDELLGKGICYGLMHCDYDADFANNNLIEQFFLQTENFDLVILDFDLPENYGENILKNMRSKNINIPVIVMYNCDNDYCKTKALEMGAYDCVSKPFDLDDLCRRVELALYKQSIKTVKNNF